MTFRGDQKENIIKRIDLITRALSESKTKMNNSEDIQKIKAGIEQDDKPKLASLLEDTLVLLKDDPDNTIKIKEKLNRIWDGYGHIKPLSEVVDQIKKYYLGPSNKRNGSSW
jgi:hypothetical protein